MASSTFAVKPVTTEFVKQWVRGTASRSAPSASSGPRTMGTTSRIRHPFASIALEQVRRAQSQLAVAGTPCQLTTIDTLNVGFALLLSRPLERDDGGGLDHHGGVGGRGAYAL